ncbi:hypothetical protein E2562_020077 [Oryza meyeriana var. granulata]|uniref:Uncharacterized protein n=1 Tax=Oryza meyeriana var. granulata TaxID=110450 RepID=A0A6G1EAH7_9ORYZ|nr:hypothetical protein E2562_020077 [Oryza meyeriana var. granulata]
MGDPGRIPGDPGRPGLPAGASCLSRTWSIVRGAPSTSEKKKPLQRAARPALSGPWRRRMSPLVAAPAAMKFQESSFPPRQGHSALGDGDQDGEEGGPAAGTAGRSHADGPGGAGKAVAARRAAEPLDEVERRAEHGAKREPVPASSTTYSGRGIRVDGAREPIVSAPAGVSVTGLRGGSRAIEACTTYCGVRCATCEPLDLDVWRT